MQLILSLLYNIQMYVAMAVIGLAFTPFAIFSSRMAAMGCHTYCRWIFWTAKVMLGLRIEVRGTPPTEPGLVAAKHQSFLDVMMTYHHVPRGFFIMKRILMYAPLIGQFGLRIGCVPVSRGKRGAAIKDMLAKVADGRQEGGQLIIYPQGTRVAPGDHKPYKVGTAALYGQMNQPCYPVALNAGVFWPKRGILRKPGVAVIEFLEPIPPGLSKEDFMVKLEHDIETASNRLMKEAGFDPDL